MESVCNLHICIMQFSSLRYSLSNSQSLTHLLCVCLSVLNKSVISCNYSQLNEPNGELFMCLICCLLLYQKLKGIKNGSERGRERERVCDTKLISFVCTLICSKLFRCIKSFISNKSDLQSVILCENRKHFCVLSPSLILSHSLTEIEKRERDFACVLKPMMKVVFTR